MSKKSDTLAAGLAIFAMFFGAGNIIFPLALGHHALDKIPYAMLGLLVTAVIIPFLGLLAIFLYRGNVRHFFGRLGTKPGLAMALFIITLLGPLGSTPRCIALAYSTWSTSFPGFSAPLFSAIACGLIFIFACRKNQLLNVLGYILTPFLVLCLCLIIVKGLLVAPPTALIIGELTNTQAFGHGLLEGYNTMDLLAAFFFAPVIISSIQTKSDQTASFRFALNASLIGASLLAVIYVGFGYLAYYYAPQIGPIAAEKLLAAIALHILGAHAGLIVCLTVILACLTTAIALMAAFTDFIYTEMKVGKKLSYKTVLAAGLLLTFGIATFEFQGISQFLSPILQICYPALILLTLVNVSQRLYELSQKGLIEESIDLKFLK
jgi:LIVCS family branched-chain amino acid:cation transporter